MRMKHALIPTLRDVPAEAQIPSHQLLLKAGYIQKVAAGMYTYLPLGKRVLAKVEKIVREEMDAADGQEILMPITQPAELWQESGRWGAYGDEMMRVVDRHGREFCLGPTHEEVVTDICRQFIRSYKQLPLRLYQIQNKYRDERRPRFGLMRGREFVMKDLYSFDMDEAGLDQAYREMYDAYSRVFTRCGLKFRPVLADSGQIGGGYTHEFMVLAENGEATIAYCDSCDFAANIEIAEAKPVACEDKHDTAAIEKIETPNIATIEDICNFLGDTPENSIKSVLMRADDELIMVLVRGDREVNDVKVKNMLGAEMVDLADEKMVRAATGSPLGFAGPVGLSVPVYADSELMGGTDYVVGANEKDEHLKHVDLFRDCKITDFHDLRLAQEGDVCPHCGGRLELTQGIEVGHIFKLGTKYSKAMHCTYLDENGKEQYMVMGCYGIGVSRALAAAIEQNHDDNGIIFPPAIAPFDCEILLLDPSDEATAAKAGELEKELEAMGLEVLVDDRAERPGIKFKDADLLGMPMQFICGAKGLGKGVVETKNRLTGEKGTIPAADLAAGIRSFRNAVSASWKARQN